MRSEHRKTTPFAHFLLWCAISFGALISATLAAGSNDYTTYSDFCAGYGNLYTVGGVGKIRDKYANGWRPQFEAAPATRAELSRPHHAIADARGNIMVVDKDAHAIRKISADGRIFTVAGTGEAGDDGNQPGPATERRLNGPNGLWVYPDGTTFILDTGNGKVRKLSRSGELSTLFTDPDGIQTGRGLWVNRDASLVYYSSGKLLKQWTPEHGIKVVADGFKQLANLAVNGQGQLYVTDRQAHRVYRISADGSKQVVAGNGRINGGGDGFKATQTGLYQVRGIWFHPNGGYFLATHKGGQVWFVDPSGFIHLFVDGGRDHQHGGDGRPFNQPGEKISEPRAISLDNLGNLLITESDYGFIRVVTRLK
ncbi:hypothetical protein [Ferrimonas kyonanensis]|uniref:hypothetical protein n=1 Tax=Ferrimonas kyonanensis TaxID=364763 RepID=UPI0003F90139|nr:hypothetical protein [Ferrimonas kyonanensis]